MPSIVASLPPAAAHLSGLTGAEAREGLRWYGPNAVEAAPPESLVRVLLRQFRSLIVGC